MPRTLICIGCGNQYEAQERRFSRRFSRYCTPKCRETTRAAVERIQVTCAKCGEPFETNKWSPGRFCSFECRRPVFVRAAKEQQMLYRLREIRRARAK